MAYHCQSPWKRRGPDHGPAFDAVLGRYVRSEVACGRCLACVANRKQNWTGKLVAEGLTSGSVAFVTLTYAEEPEDFVYEDIQRFMKRLRVTLWRRHRELVRFFCVGEKGDLNGRRHWHLLLFFRNGHMLPEWFDQYTKWEFWPEGWTAIEMLRGERLVQKIRYCVMYAVKQFGQDDLPRARGSFMPALGTEYLVDMAKRLARAGLAATGRYNLPGIIWDEGMRAGQHQTFSIVGGNVEDFITAYVSEWRATWGDKPVPDTEWMARNWDDYCFRATGAKSLGVRREGAMPVEEAPEPEVGVEVHTATRVGYVQDQGGWVAVVRVWQRGGDFVVTAEDHVPHLRREVKASVGRYIAIPDEAARELDEWVAGITGFNLEAKYERQKQEATARKAARREWLEEACARSEEVLRTKHGSSRGAPGIYNRAYNPRAEKPAVDWEALAVKEREAQTLGFPA